MTTRATRTPPWNPLLPGVGRAPLDRGSVLAVFFWGRHVAVALIATALLLGPLDVSRRLAVAAILVGVALPFGVLMHVLTRRSREVALPMAIVDPLVIAFVTAISPETWVGALVGGVALVAVLAVLLGPGPALLAAIVATVGLGAASPRWVTPDVATTMVTFTICVPIVALVLGAVIRVERTTRSRFAELAADVEAVIWEADPGSDGFAFVSRRAEALLGYPLRDWLADDGVWPSKLHADDRERALLARRSVETDGRPAVVDYRLVANDGREVWVHDSMHSETDASGRVVRVRGVMFDATALHESATALKRSEQRYRELFDNASDVVYTMTLDGIVTSMNKHGCLRLGYDEHELIGGSVNRIIAPEYRQMSEGMGARKVETGQHTTYQLECITRAGERIPVEVSSNLIVEDGRPVGIQGIVRDITERHRAQEALRESERAYAEAYAREREAAEQLRAADELKNTFLQAVSHELRTPLTSVVGFADTLERRADDLNPDQRRELLYRLAANARRLERLLSDLLDLDRLNRGILSANRRPTDLGELIERTVGSYDLPPAWTVRASYDSIAANVDGPKIERIVENLLSNAVRHTPVGTTIWVRLTEVDDGVVISVEDDGPGVPEHLKDDIFNAFAQGNPAQEHSPGVGIGLSLVARFAEIHDGVAWVEDRRGGGAAFRVLLPRPDVGAAQASAPEDGDEPASATIGP